jgi:hypothetical protein
MEPNGTAKVLVPPTRGLATQALIIAILAGILAGSAAWLERRHPSAPLDLDGWGHLVTRLQTSTHSFQELFRQPSLWKGPIVPFVFGFCYYLFPVPEAVLVFNAMAFSCAAGCLFLAFRRLGAGVWEAAVPAVLWGSYPPHRIVFGYYFAEPLLSLLSALLFLVAARLAFKPARGLALAGGVLAGVLVLARAPFLPVAAGLGVWILFRGGKQYRACCCLFFLGLMAALLPWPIRNLMMEGTFIPFTTEGGKILFQGTYLAGDDQIMSELRRMPEFQQLEQEEADKSPVEQMRYWQSLAVTQIREHPAEQLLLCLRKAMRFWVYLPSDSWIPTWKTGIVAALCLALAAVAVWRGWREPLVQLCVLWIGGLWLFHAVVHAELRYNLPVLPMLFLLAWRGGMCLLSAGIGSKTSQGTNGAV